MDIDLLAKMVEELILDNDEVSLPGVGTFVAELIPATFSDKGFTINPPYRKLSFRQREGDGNLLVDFYAKANSLETGEARRILTKFLEEMKEVLKVKKYIIFPGLGKLRATKENFFFFVPDENLNIYPEGFGLESVSLKSHKEVDDVALAAEVLAAEVAEANEAAGGTEVAEPLPVKEVVETAVTEVAAPAPLAAEKPAPLAETPVQEPVPAEEPAAVAETVPVEEPVEEPDAVPEPVPAEEAVPEPVAVAEPVPVEEPVVTGGPDADALVQTDRPKKRMPAWLKVLIILVALAILFFGALAILGRVAPEFVDKLLYTPEELQLLYR